ncbi:hypothetical protein K2X30_13960 [bacterium]|nr:hypothetical protein [bacterium]
MMRRLSSLVGLAAAVGLVMSAAVAPKANAAISDKFSLSGWAQTMFRNDMTSNNGNNKTGFDADEVELDLAYKYDDTWTANVGMLMGHWSDSNSLGAPASSYKVPFFFLKRANVEGKNLLGDGTKLVFGLQGTPYVNMVEGPWGFNWLDGYTLAIQNYFVHRHEAGIRMDGSVGPLGYSVFISSGESFYSNAIQNDNGIAGTLAIQYKPMDDLTIVLVDNLYGAASGKAGANVLGGSVMWKTDKFGILAEVMTAESRCKDSTWTQSAFGGTNWCNGAADTTIIKPMGYGVSAFANLTDHWGLYGQYYSGNSDFANGNAGAHNQWSYTDSTGTEVKQYKSRITVGPTYTFYKDKLRMALLYSTQDLTDARVTANAGVNMKNMSHVRFNFGANF